MPDSKVVDTIQMITNPDDNGGEALGFSAKIHDNGDDENNIFAIGSVSLQSYGRSAVINLGAIDPQMFRDFANRLESAMVRRTRTK